MGRVSKEQGGEYDRGAQLVGSASIARVGAAIISVPHLVCALLYSLKPAMLD